MRKERQTIELLKLIANQDLSKLIDKYDYLGVQLAYRSYATDILRANDIQCISKVETDEDRLREVEEYRTNNGLKMEKDLEKQIEEAAKIISAEKYDRHDDFCNQYYPHKEGFVKGAKSEAAKEYWQQGLYTEEEVKKMCRISFEFYMSDDSYSDEELEDKWKEWFERNKKK